MKRMIRVSPIAVAFFLLIATCISAHSQQTYLLRSNGEVRVNGIAIPGSTVISPGDVIETSKGSAAKIAAPGVSMLVGENSRVSVKSGSLAVDQGSANVSTNSGILTGASQYSISGTGTTKYQIANTAGSLSVLSTGGPLTISGPSGRAASLQSGQKGVFPSSSASSAHSASMFDSSTVGFQPMSSSPITQACKNARECVCRDGKQCVCEVTNTCSSLK